MKRAGEGLAAIAPRGRRSRAARLLRGGLLLGAIALLAGLAPVAASFARIAAGYAATITALQVLGAGDALATVEAERLEMPLGLGRFVEVDVDPATRTARATAFGLVTREAVWRPGLGATRRTDGDRPVESLPALELAPLPPLDADLPWPLGESAALAPLPGDLRAALEDAVASAFVDEASGAPVATHAVLVVHRGRLVAERYAAGVDAHKPLLGWSMTKSTVAALLGRLIELGRAAGIEEPVLAPEWRDPADPRRAIRVEHLLRMTSGLAFLADYEVPWSDSLNMLFVAPAAAAFAAAKPLEHTPGTRWSYSDGSTNVLARWIQERAGATREERVGFARRELFAPCRMETAVISVDASDTWVGSSLMQASARDWARLGLLFLDDGVFDGRRLLPAGWVELLSAATPGSDHRSYGAHVWRYDPECLRDSDAEPVPSELGGTIYFAGHDQQYVWIDRTRGLVVLRLGLADERFHPTDFLACIVRLDWP